MLSWRAPGGLSDGFGKMAAMDVEIGDDMIRLGQVLKLAGVVEDGAAARAVIEAGRVRVDGVVETRRGRQIHPGDVITYAAHRLRVVRSA